MSRKPIPKKLREQVYAKYNGHCAYCGCKLDYKDMQADHANSLWSKAYPDGQRKVTDDPSITQDDSIENLMPACRQCNFYKEACNIEQFRTILKESFEKNSLNTWQIRFGIKYGMIEKHPWDGKFYFEKETNNENQ